MIWHIFKKDVRLLWHYALGLAVVQGLTTVLLYKNYPVEAPAYMRQLLGLIEDCGPLGAGLLIAAVIHLDAIPGVRQDWLVRPVRRRDLLAAKLLFVILMVLGPVLLASWAGALAQGFGWERSLGAALSHSLAMLVFFFLPVMAFASLTRNFAETAVGIIIGAAAFTGLAQVASMITIPVVSGTSAGWLLYMGYALVLFLAAAVVLSVQYFRRKTRWSQGLTVLAGVMLLCVSGTPWRPVFAIEQRLSPDPGAASTVRLLFRPGLGRHPRSGGGQLDRRNESRFELVIPVGVAGLLPDTILVGDQVTASLTEPGGKNVDLGLAGRWQILNEGPSTADKALYTPVYVRDDLYSKLQHTPLQLEIQYSLTMLRLSDVHAIPAIGEQQRISGVGRCGTTLNPAGTAIQIKCIEAGLRVAPTCMTYFLEHVPSGRRNPVIPRCWPSYMPFFAEVQPDAMMRFGAAVLQFRDPSGLAQYPVDATQLKDSRVVMRVYKAADHFTRSVVIPDIRLSDWLPQ